MPSFPALTQFINRITSVFQENAVASTVMMIVSLVLMLAFCFAGYRAMKLFATITGFLIGWMIGYGIIVPQFRIGNEGAWAVPLIIALVVGALGFFFYRVGLFIAILSSVYSSFLPLLSATSLKEPFPMIIALAAGLVLAILGVKLLRSAIIFATAYAGAFGFTGILFDSVIQVRVGTQEGTIIRLVLGILIGTIGLVYQFRSSS